MILFAFGIKIMLHNTFCTGLQGFCLEIYSYYRLQLPLKSYKQTNYSTTVSLNSNCCHTYNRNKTN